MGLTQATTYIDDATAYRMEVQGQDANVEYESNGTAPAEINPHWDICNLEWEVSVKINPMHEFAHPLALGEYINELDDVAKVAEDFRTVLNKNHRPHRV
ncbi:hypothetical protein HMPREF1261_00420 [Corynebacterium sp. KPL1818]|uniref:hypothetical protein n=1 Tax=Corynebacterium sp. KPL1818 TaxID=1203559 RepID=UPI0003B90FAD|nr:hypothetical protein [Corynebacterium sp. KPL1818]ERS60756.1 hypothetical protein HMPREF1261_00420 [Corynebacterium sp. KPL1818]